MNRSAENYIKTIYMLKRENNSLRSVDIARELGFSRASVSLAMTNLRKNNIIVMKEDGEIDFTEKGREIAGNIYDKYTMLYGFLKDVVGVDENIAKEDASSIGCYISDPTYEGIKRFIGRQA